MFLSFIVTVVPKTVMLSTLKLVLARVSARLRAAVDERSITALETMMDRAINVMILNNNARISIAATLLAIASYTKNGLAVVILEAAVVTFYGSTSHLAAMAE